MKKPLCLSLCLFFLFPAAAECREPVRRSLFVSVIQQPPVLESRDAIRELIAYSKKARVDTLFIQIYRANKAWFPSTVGDASPYKDAFIRLGEDPFALLIREAHAANIEVHAWVNLLSLSTNAEAPLLKKYGPEILTKNLEEKKAIEDYKIDDQFFLEPGDPRVREELSQLVEKLVRTYPDLDGVQFDYIRYPDTKPAYGYTELNIARFKEATGIEAVEEYSKVWRQWKRDQVTGLLQMLVTKTREIRPDIHISTTGCTSSTRAYHEAFQEWPLWLDSGLVEFVTIMGYSPDLKEFEHFIKDAKKQTDHFDKVNIGIGPYELAQIPEVFQKEIEICEKTKSRGCAVFHYGSLVDTPALAEVLT